MTSIDLTTDDTVDLLTALLGTAATLHWRWEELDDATRRELIALVYRRVGGLVGAVDLREAANHT